MPRLNSLGSALMGVGSGVNSVDGAIVPALSAAVGAGGDWFTDGVIVTPTNLGLGAGLNIYSVVLATGVTTLVLPNGANYIKAGGGVFQRMLGGVATNVVAVPSLPNAGTGWVDWDGTWCVVTTYGFSSGITVYSKIGTVLQQINVTLIGRVIMRDGLLSYFTANGWPLVDSQTGTPVSGYVQQIGTTGLVPMESAAGPLVLEYNGPATRFTLRRISQATGLIIAEGDPTIFNWDAVVLPSGLVRMAWSTGAGELPSELVTLDIDTSTGATIRGTVSGGVMVYALGPTLAGDRFSMSTASAVRLPYEQSFSERDAKTGRNIITLPWKAALEKLVGNVATNTTNANNIAPPTPASAFDVSALVETTNAAFPQARVMVDSASIIWDFTVPGEVSATASGAGIYDQDLNTFNDVQFNSLTIGLAAPPEANAQAQVKAPGAAVALPTSWEAQVLLTGKDLTQAQLAILTTDFSDDVQDGLLIYQDVDGKAYFDVGYGTAGNVGMEMFLDPVDGVATFFGKVLGDPPTINNALSTAGNTYQNRFFTRFTATDLADTDVIQVLRSELNFGEGGVASVGTGIAGSDNVVVAGCGDADNEYAAKVDVLRVDIGTGYTQTTGPVGRSWLYDLSVLGPIAVQPDLLNGVTVFANNYYNGSPADSPSGGLWIVTRKGSGGGSDALHTAANTYAMDVGLGIVGISDVGGVTGTGWTTGIQVGGFGSGWMESGVSKIGTGIKIRECSSADVDFTGFFEGTEMAAPSAPAANKGRLFFRDVAGKTQLACIFNSGAIQPIATEP